VRGGGGGSNGRVGEDDGQRAAVLLSLFSLLPRRKGRGCVRLSVRQERGPDGGSPARGSSHPDDQPCIDGLASSSRVALLWVGRVVQLGQALTLLLE